MTLAPVGSMECPRCKRSCIRLATEVLSKIDRIYMACPSCAAAPPLDKAVERRRLRGDMLKRCAGCGRAPLDLVMLEALDILIEHGQRDLRDSLKSVGWPLVEIGYPLAYAPRLGVRELIIVSDRIDRKAAAGLMGIPEIKGVIRGVGVPGVSDSLKGGRQWELLAGCDMRCDVVQSIFGDLVIYKSQSQIHIEFSRQGAPKVRRVEGLRIHGKTVIDGLCGPGTLGLVSALAGAKKVILNDIWLPAVENVLLNLEVNRELLGLDEIVRFDRTIAQSCGPASETEAVLLGGEPVLMGRASGLSDIEVYHGDLKCLFERIMPADICLIDHFPGSPTEELENACSSCREVFII